MAQPDRRGTGFILDTDEELAYVRQDQVLRSSVGKVVRFGTKYRPVDGKLLPFGSTGLPSSASVWTNKVAIRDQEDVGSCTAQAYCRAVRLYSNAQTNNPGPDLSPAQLYAMSRLARLKAYGNDGAIVRLEDTGVNPLHVTSAATQLGITTEEIYPYRTLVRSASDIAQDVPSFDIACAASVMRVVGDFRIDADDLMLQQVRAALVHGLPVLCAFVVREEYDQFWNKRESDILDAQKGSTNYGGHANVISAFKDDLFLVDNSWSDQWGYGGSAWVTEAFVKQCMHLSVLHAALC